MDRAVDVNAGIPTPPSRFPPKGETGHVRSGAKRYKYTYLVEVLIVPTYTTTQPLPHHDAGRPLGGPDNYPGQQHCLPGSSFSIIHQVKLVNSVK